jgi:hypothetical protein
MKLKACAADQGSVDLPNLAFIGEQSGNGRTYHQTIAVRQARTRSANTSAVQTISVVESLRACVETAFAAAGAAGVIRITYAIDWEQKQKRPRIDRGL